MAQVEGQPGRPAYVPGDREHVGEALFLEGGAQRPVLSPYASSAVTQAI